ncbi:MAG: hypothetical protein R2762_08725 [Bryobacteraceae bacterium]
MNDNWKPILGAFALGIAVAAGVLWIAGRGGETAVPDASRAAAPAPPAVSEVREIARADAIPEEPEPAPVRPARTPERTRTAPKVAAKPAPRAVPVPAAPAPRPEPEPAPRPDPEPAPVAKPAPSPVASAPAPAPKPVLDPPSATRTEEPKPRVPRSVSIPDGTLIAVSLNERISSETHAQGDSFSAVLAEPIVVEGLVIAEKNSRVTGRIFDAQRSGKVKGLAHLSLELTSITTSDKQVVPIRTAQFVKQAEDSKKEDAKKVGIGAAIGAAIGAIAGGGKGAAIGAGAGAGAGAGSVVLTRGNEAELPIETRLSFRLTEPVKITEKLN